MEAQEKTQNVYKWFPSTAYKGGSGFTDLGAHIRCYIKLAVKAFTFGVSQYAFCNLLPWNRDFNSDETGFYITSTDATFKIPKESLESYDYNGFIKFCEQTGLYIVYCLDTPVITPLDAETISAYRALISYDGTTNIFSDEDVGIEVEVVTDKIDKNGYADPNGELTLYYKALAGFMGLKDLPMPHSGESALVRKLIDPSYELPLIVTKENSRNERYLWDLVNGTKEMLLNVPMSNTEKFLHIMLGGTVDRYPEIHSELDYWMDICATYYNKM